MQDVVVYVVVAAILSAASLPLGAMLGVYWRPSDKQMAFFLHSAAAPCLPPWQSSWRPNPLRRAAGHVMGITIGAIFGGLVLKGLNWLVNNRGGYLRKPSTAINDWKGKAARRFSELVQDLKRLRLAESLSSEVIEALLPHVLVRIHPKDTILYRRGDPAETLYIIEQGEVDLLDPKEGRKCFAYLAEHAAFGRLSFLIGCPRATEAVTATDARLLIS